LGNIDQVVAEQRRLLKEVMPSWLPLDPQRIDDIPRLMTQEQWQYALPFLKSRVQRRAPVLYAMVRETHVSEGFFFPREENVQSLITVSADGQAHRVACRSRFSEKNIVYEDDKLVVPRIGGIPKRPVLYLILGGRESIHGPIERYRFVAPDGTRQADTIRALYLVAEFYERDLLSSQRDRPAVDPVRVKLTRVPPGILAEARPARASRRKSLPSPEPQPRLVRDTDEAKQLAAEWVRWMGWKDAEATQVGSGQGVDVSGTKVAAQVKFGAVKIGRPVLQRLYGAGHAIGAEHWLFFSSAGFTGSANDWADVVGMGLFRFALDGTIEPVNTAATRYLHRTS
jgi:hypothetical protein